VVKIVNSADLDIFIDTYPVSMSIFCLSHIALFIYYTSVPIGTEAKDRSKINKQGCDLPRKGHGNGIFVTHFIKLAL